MISDGELQESVGLSPVGFAPHFCSDMGFSRCFMGKMCVRSRVFFVFVLLCVLLVTGFQ